MVEPHACCLDPHLVYPRYLDAPAIFRCCACRPSKSISMKKNKDTTRLEVPNFASADEPSEWKDTVDGS